MSDGTIQEISIVCIHLALVGDLQSVCQIGLGELNWDAFENCKALVASLSVSRPCFNIAEKALPISHGIEPGPIRVLPVVNSTIRSRSGSPTMTVIRSEVSITTSMSISINYGTDNCATTLRFFKG